MIRFMLLAHLIYPTIDIFDSRTDPKYMNIVINHECMVSIEKSRMKDKEYVQNKVDKECGESFYLNGDTFE